MNETLHLSLHTTDWLNLFLHYLSLSLLSLGGALVTAPEMHRYLVAEQNWLTEPQFSASISIAQAAPGPNILFVALMGWNIGLNAGSMTAGLLGMLITMTGIMIPSSLFTYTATRWVHHNRELRSVRAFKQGMGPIVVGLMLATGWILASTHSTLSKDWPLWLLTTAIIPVVLKTKIHILWLLLIGAALGWFGLV
ncbi:chromate transporter [Herminiimonas fonticola]|uniref:Chromate transporter n=1 Tax=Herminiimonas fonticola TaxID=303380 RepID=A0A4R6GFE5_9BURK|nr:chromate transporter [Herminiimonas fonticola]RBA24425.1 Chromate transport protein ChrA [Herminiimonas fonticola]TDN93542.1 chromate transporter [Herminiimonas fonticola]